MSERLFFAGLLLLVLCSTAFAYETDQFTHRQQQIADAQSVLDQKVNLAIGESILGVTHANSEKMIINRIYRKLGGLATVGKIESWAMHSDEIERMATSEGNSIYAGIPIWASRLTGLAGIGATIKIDGALLGTDKLGHFFSQGRIFYVRWAKTQDLEMASEYSAYSERAIFGQMTTGSYSNADLVANYEGFRFYRDLFEADASTDKPAILAWKGDHWIMQRPFEWSDYVNDYWDEALNINYYSHALYPYMKERLLELCPWYLQHSNLYQIHDEASLNKRYDFLHFKDTSELRLSNLCVDTSSTSNKGMATGNR